MPREQSALFVRSPVAPDFVKIPTAGWREMYSTVKSTREQKHPLLEHPAHQDHDAGVPENKAKLISEKVEVKKQKVSKVSSKQRERLVFLRRLMFLSHRIR